MGSKFANVQVFCGDVERVQALCPRHTALRLADGWVTVVSESIEWGSAQKVARDLSKQLPCAVMSVEYFDDDFVEFAVYTGGTRAARHRPTSYESYERKAGKPKDFAQIFALGDGAEETLRQIFKETDAEESVRLLEALLGCVLWVDYDNYESEYTPPGRGYIDEYFAKKEEEKERAKIKNRTKMVLVDEMGGEFEGDLLITHDPDNPGKKTFWDVSDDGHFVKRFELDLPAQAVVGRILDRCDDRMLLQVSGLWQTGGSVALMVLSEQGEVVEIVPRDWIFREATFLGKNHVFCDGRCIDILNHEFTWDRLYSFRQYNLCSARMLTEDKFLVLFGISDIFKREPESPRPYEYLLDMERAVYDGRGGGRIRLPRPLIAVEYRTYKRKAYVFYITEDSPEVGHVVCYDENLDELWHIEIQHLAAHTQIACIDEATDRMYLSSNREIVVVDLEKCGVCARRELTETEGEYVFNAVLDGIGIVMLHRWKSVVEIWDYDFNVLSRHRADGRFIRRGDRWFLVTHTESREYIGAGTSRIYELVPLKKK